MELLVVVAIIGMLSSVVLTSLNAARSKGADAAVRANLANTRAEASIFFDANNGSYDNVCLTTGTAVIGDGVNAAELAYRGAVTGYLDSTASTWNTAQCHDSANAWAAWVPLKASASGSILAWCVDSTGIEKQTTTVLAANIYVCP
jgi:type II secretory pathway pseudopilin PulG